MSVDLSPESKQFLREIVASGLYKSEKDAIDDAIELLKRRAAFRRDVEAGIAEARAAHIIDADEVFGELEQEIHRIENSSK